MVNSIKRVSSLKLLGWFEATYLKEVSYILFFLTERKKKHLKMIP